MKVSIQKLIDNKYPLSVKIDTLRWIQKTGNIVRCKLVSERKIQRWESLDNLFFGYSYRSNDDGSIETISENNLEMGFINIFCRNKEDLLLNEWKKEFAKSDFINIHTDKNYLPSILIEKRVYENIFHDLSFLSKGNFRLKKELWHNKKMPQYICKVRITVGESIELRYDRVDNYKHGGCWSESIWQGKYPKLNKASTFLPFAINELKGRLIL